MSDRLQAVNSRILHRPTYHSVFSRIRENLPFGLLSILSLSAYLFASRWIFRIGFPLDDAWIHQTYARNLIQYGEWAFIPGQPSAGSTAPLWSGLLAFGYIFNLGPYIWTFFLGWTLLLAVAVLGRHTFSRLVPGHSRMAVIAGLLLLFEWHLVWAAGSGMETLLFAFFVLLTLAMIIHDQERWFLLGMLIGASVWIRPDGITLIGPVGFVILLKDRSCSKRLKSVTLILLGLLLFLIPYFSFNRLLAGAWFPNTFFAKQAEYAIYQQIPLWERYLAQIRLSLVGVGAVLLPGFLFALWRSLKFRQFGVAAGAVWFLGYLFLYAWRLPVTYQHGRYIIPAMPVLLIWGFAGLAQWSSQLPQGHWRRILRKAWAISTTILLAYFWFLGARSYGHDVAIIETEMVETAGWVSENTAPDALIAAHDIGAIGFYAERDILDLAGLVSPDAIAFLRDEAALSQFLDQRGADYLVVFPGWYENLPEGGELVYQGEEKFSINAGGENMAVYRWIAR